MNFLAMKAFFCVVLLQAFFMEENSALFCHICVTSKNPANDTCMVNKNETKLEICPGIPDQEKQLGASPVCFKVTKTVKNGDEEKMFANRGCIFSGGSTTSDAFCANVTKNDNSTECHVCRTDGCNHGNGLDIFMPMIFGFILIYLILSR